MDVKLVLSQLKDTVEKEKLRLDYILKGAELLADMLARTEETSGNKTSTEQYSESGLEAEASSRESPSR